MVDLHPIHCFATQLCINVANEQFQHYFNEHIFQLEIEECSKEGIDSIGVTYVSNKPLLELFLEVSERNIPKRF